MKRIIYLISAIACTSFLWGQTTVTFIEEDFENVPAGQAAGTVGIFKQNNNAAVTLTDDPVAGGTQGKVLAVDLSGGTEWGAVNTVPDLIDLPSGVEPGVAAYKMSMMIYVPSTTTLADPDQVGLIVRWNGGTGDQSTFVQFANFTYDTWVPLEHTGFVPVVGNDGLPPTKVFPIVSFNDKDIDAAAGTAIYIDDYKFDVDVSDDDPNLNLGTAISFGDVDQNGGPVTKVLNLDNSGSAQTLTISSITLSGTNAALFSIDGVTLPLDIAPGESAQATLTHDPLENLGFLSAQIDVASNDASTPNIQVNVDSNSVVPFEGVEFILNGDFEELNEGTTDLTSWRNNDRFTSSTDVARSGTNSAVFNLPGGSQWNEARFQHDDNVDVATDSIAITPDMYGKEMFYSGWYLNPVTGGLSDDEKLRVIFRWNSFNGAVNGLVGPVTVGALPKGIWQRISGTVVIPAVDLNGDPTTYVTLLWSFEDVGLDSAAGAKIYLDDISMKIDVPVVVPAVELIITNLIVDKTTNNVSFDFPAEIGADYSIERSTTLLPSGQPGGWIEIDDPTATSTMETFTDSGAAATSPVYFYRVTKL